MWLRVELPEVVSNPGYQARWTRNVGHNIIDEAYLQFNDLTVNKLTSYHMDFLAAFLIPEAQGRSPAGSSLPPGSSTGTTT